MADSPAAVCTCGANAVALIGATDDTDCSIWIVLLNWLGAAPMVSAVSASTNVRDTPSPLVGSADANVADPFSPNLILPMARPRSKTAITAGRIHKLSVAAVLFGVGSPPPMLEADAGSIVPQSAPIKPAWHPQVHSIRPPPPPPPLSDAEGVLLLETLATLANVSLEMAVPFVPF